MQVITKSGPQTVVKVEGVGRWLASDRSEHGTLKLNEGVDYTV